MPEIAEVRTVAKTLNERLTGKRIESVEVIYKNIIEDDIDFFKERVEKKSITGVSNYGKYLFIVLGEDTILSHLRMEGKYFIKSESDPIEKHEHIIFHLDDDMTLRYHDTRKFGRMRVLKTDELYKSEEISKLGVQPDHESLSKEYVYHAIHKKKKPIKTLLLDQTIINGLGNIYADEVLFAANIHPETLGSKVTLEECERIVNACKNIITKATKCGGTTIRSYTSSLGVYGSYQEFLMVHTKNNEKCKVCGSIIEKCRVGGRGTYYCPKCQIKK